MWSSAACTLNILFLFSTRPLRRNVRRPRVNAIAGGHDDLVQDVVAVTRILVICRMRTELFQLFQSVCQVVQELSFPVQVRLSFLFPCQDLDPECVLLQSREQGSRIVDVLDKSATRLLASLGRPWICPYKCELLPLKFTVPQPALAFCVCSEDRLL